MNRETELIYCVFTRCFGENGTFKDVEERLEYIRALGVTVLWLLPFYPLGVKNRKGTVGSPYAVRDFKGIDPSHGTAEDLKRLVSKAQNMGMRVIFDFVCGHCAQDHEWVLREGWIRCDEKGRPQYSDPEWDDIYALNYRNEDVRAAMEDVLRFWLTEFGIDGFRVDAADKAPPDFWQMVIPALRHDFPELLMLAEGQGTYWHSLGFDWSYDGDLRCVYWDVLRNRRTAQDIGRHLVEQADQGRRDSGLMRFTETHDIGRTAALFNPQEAALVSGFTFALPGIPMLYAGQECGLQAYPDIFERIPLDWSKGSDRHEQIYREVIAFRKKYPQLQAAEIQIIESSSSRQVLAYLLRCEDDSRFICVMNFSGEPVVAWSGRLPGTVRYRCDVCAGCTRYNMDDSGITVNLAPFDFCILRIMPADTQDTSLH